MGRQLSYHAGVFCNVMVFFSLNSKSVDRVYGTNRAYHRDYIRMTICWDECCVLLVTQGQLCRFAQS